MDWKDIQILAAERLVWIIVFMSYAFFIFLNPGLFLNPFRIFKILDNRAAVGVIAVAQGLCLLSGSMDLSLPGIGGMAGATVIAVGSYIGFTGWAGVLLIFLPIILGALLGFFNGFVITKSGIHPFLITLASLLMFQGARQRIWYEGKGIFSGPVVFPGGGTIFGEIPFSVVLLVGITMALWVLLRWTNIGVRIYAIGENVKASELMGIDSGYNILFVHVMAGAISGLGGLLYLGNNMGYEPLMLEGTIFMVFAMAVIGGISLQGGRGNIEDVIAGVLFIGIVYVGLNMGLNINPHVIDMIIGIFIILGVIINSFRLDLRDRLLMSS
ncbi:MAG: ABC transporter permease [Candidatus Hadarchaeota archaeon]